MPSYAPEKLQDFACALASRLKGDLRLDGMTRALYATDASMYQVMPAAVLLPRHTDDVQAALETADAFGLPVLARGSGSSLAGQTTTGGLVIDFSRHLDAILEINGEERWAHVQPGVVLDHLEARLRPLGLMVGPDPASSNRATLGGMMANNATGTHSILYGNVIQHLLEAGVLLADGTATRFEALDTETFISHALRSGLEGRLYAGVAQLLTENREIIQRDTPRHWRRNSGYRLEHLLEGATRNLAHLVCGSEGTLAVVTDLKIGLVARPRRTVLGIVHFHTRREALLATTAILETGPSAVELFDGHAIRQTRTVPSFAKQMTFVQGDPGAILFTEYYVESDAEALARLAELDRVVVTSGLAYACVPALEPVDIAHVWNIRKEALGIITGVKGDVKPQPFIEDASVPVEHLADYIDDLDRLLVETDTPVAMYAHASAGCLHVRPFINTKDAQEVEKMRTIAQGSMELVRKYGGAVSSEHGDGVARGWLNEALLGPELYQVCRQLKGLFDPRNQLNPGKVVDAPSMTENLRLGPDYRTMPLRERLDFSADGGYAASVELCNGNGACRKLTTGVMCPSFMVTREEEHSTRGRANALRSAMSGLLGPDAFTSQRLYEVLDLCVECKGCKSECPSNVDMARLKTEWLSHYWDDHKMPARTRLFARLPYIMRKMPSTLAGMANRVGKSALLRRQLEKTMGIDARRELPPFAREPFTDWFSRRTWKEDGPEVVLFADSFNNYNHPETSRAAAEFFHLTGHRVTVPDAKACCGRTLLSKGLVDDARALARRTVDILYPFAERGLPIVGLEPSCILTFRDELGALMPGDTRAQAIASSARTFEEYVAERADEGAFGNVRWKPGEHHLLVHGHCHQKAIVGMEPAKKALAIPTGARVDVVESSCCGMAGAFGYETEHYDVSIAMAERSLAPAVRAARNDTTIVAAGVSCRSQIKDTTGRRALHPAEVLRDLLVAGAPEA